MFSLRYATSLRVIFRSIVCSQLFNTYFLKSEPLCKWYIYTLEHYSEEENGILKITIKWMELEEPIPGEVTESQKVKLIHGY